jgi:probable F420-dependent oxidoreductase
MGAMKLGLFGINFGPCGDPEVAARVARAAEAAGYESVWTGEHVVLPDPQVPPSPAAPHTPMLDPAVALAFLAGQTRRLRLGTGIIILPQRNPLVLAKELASVDVVSGGRLIFGLGSGYLRPEFDALGVSFAEKGARTSEAIEVLRALWTQDQPSFRGRYWSFSGIQAKPLPVQKPHPPIVVGGHVAGAFRRAALQGNGWYGFALDLERTRACVEGLETAKKSVERPAGLGPLEIGVTPSLALDRDTARRYEDLGVSRLVPIARGRTADEIVEFAEKTARAVLG